MRNKEIAKIDKFFENTLFGTFVMAKKIKS
jgi:hypothetical protein